ncbi:hypothetical protein SEUCBS139899_002882 [Sporothrix eucalyptigena]|uniref:Major facilitator superfamily (MFS) profile domain-containing protein n=1 Tax=Sporothrix eucalyptigena TaxID=1812306 RepID=A0ABP0BY32_9PEZI
MSITAMEQDTVTTSSDKVDVVHHDGLEKQLTVEPLPEALRLEAGVLMNIDTNAGTSLRLAANGHTVLIPQPTDDPDDPLNWSAAKKHTVLLTIAWGALVADFTSAAGSAPIFLQAGEWEKSVSQINQTNSINVLMMALGSLVWVPMTSYIGRAPTLFWSSIMACAFSIGAVLSPNYTCFYAMRALTGINATSAQTISIAFIRDMFFLHERARKIGLWAALYISSPYLGPLLGNFVLGGNGTWQDVYWLSVGVCGIDLVLIAVFLDETWYNRTVHRAAQPPRGRGVLARMARLTGTWQLRHRRPYFTSVSTAYRKLFITLTKPTIFLVLLA